MTPNFDEFMEDDAALLGNSTSIPGSPSESDEYAWERYIDGLSMSEREREPSEEEVIESRLSEHEQLRTLGQSRATAVPLPSAPFVIETSDPRLGHVQREIQRLRELLDEDRLGGLDLICWPSREVIVSPPHPWRLGIPSDWIVSFVSFETSVRLYLEVPSVMVLPVDRPRAELLKAADADEKRRQIALKGACFVERTPDGFICYALTPNAEEAIRAALGLDPVSPGPRRRGGRPRKLNDTELLAAERKFLRLGDRELAKRLGVHRTTILRTRGSRPRFRST